MKKTSLRRLMHLVLAAAATDAAFACGGAMTSDVEGTEPGGTANGASSSSSSSSGATSSGNGGSSGTSGTTTTDPPEEEKPKPKDGGIDANKPDVVVIDANKPDTWTSTCITGQIDPDPSFCCATPNDPNCQGGGGGGDQCAIDCKAVCDKVAPGVTGGFESCYYTASATNPKIGYMCGMCGVGRIPDGAGGCERGDSIGERLAMQAYYEGVSVIAFRRLADVLASENAPQSLIDRVRAAAEDEERHASTFTQLANDRGVCVKTPEIDERFAHPSLLDLAIENAREGCVRETYGALVALHQATHAEEAELRAAFASIADDEVAHAALSWDLAAFFEERLGESHLAHRTAAAAGLRFAATRDHDAIDRALGVPQPAKARVLFDDLFARLAA